MRKFFRKSMAGVHPGVAQSAFTAVEALESRSLYSASVGGHVAGSASLATPSLQLAQQSPTTITGFTAVSKSSGIVSLTWTTPLAAVGSVSIISSVGRQSFPSLSLPAGATGVQIANVHPGWSIDFQVTSGSAASAVATLLVAGSNAAPYSGNPVIQSVVTPPVVTPPPVTPSTGILGFVGVSSSSGTVQLSWTTPLPAAGLLTIITTQGRQAFPSLTLAAGATSATVQNVHSGWQIDFQITSAAQTSAVATVVVAGNYSTAYSGNPTLVGPTTTPPVVTPPIAPPHVVTPPVVVTPVTTTPPATGGGTKTTLLDGAAMPGPTNTGPTNSSILTPSGSIVVTTAGAVIQNLAVTGTIEIEAPNVTVRNCTINANGNYDALQIDAGANNCTVEDTSVTGTGTGGFAIETNAAVGNTFLRMNVYNTGDQGFHLGGASTVQGCWLHEIGWNAAGIKSNPSKPGFNGLDHVEDFFIETGASFNFSDNNFQTPDFVTVNGVNYGTTTAVFFIDPYSAGDHVGHVTINSNYIDGGGYMFYLMGQGPYTISNNIIGPDEQYALIYSSYIGGPWSWLNNVDQNGNSISIPTGLPVSGTN